jgi:hypothetical protein
MGIFNALTTIKNFFAGLFYRLFIYNFQKWAKSAAAFLKIPKSGSRV